VYGGKVSESEISRNWTQGDGGGLYGCESIYNCTISGNFAGYAGGGLYGCSGTVNDCTIKENEARHDGGGLCECDADIDNCIISDNLAGDNGGGLYKCDGDISNCTITNNSGGGLNRCGGPINNCNISGNTSEYGGGGLYLCGAINNCTITGNSAGRFGGGILTPLSTVSNCTITGNIAAYGGAIAVDQRSPTIRNCTVSENTAYCSGGGIHSHVLSDPTVINCIMWANTSVQGDEISVALFDDPWAGDIPSSITVNYSDVEGGAGSAHVDPGCTLNWGADNIDVNPYCLQGGYQNIYGTPEDAKYLWIEGDYHLKWDSLCINAGDPAGDYTSQTDIDDEPRVLYGQVDMGSDEVYPVAGDSEPDEDVDLADLAACVNYWLSTCSEPNWCSSCDIDQSSVADFVDFAKFVNHWLWSQ
jgi:predicted outer membrane repeat protein